MRLFPILCLLLLSLGVASRQRHRSRSWEKKVKESSGLTHRIEDFAFDLYRALASEAPGQNVVFSPLSVSMSLGMLSLGTSSNTKTQILESLGLSLQQGQEDKFHKGFQQLLQRFSQLRDGLQLSLGSALFADPAVHIRDSFLSAMKTLYMADTLSTNFGNPEMAKKQINDYVAKRTRGKIVDLIKDLDNTNIMVLINYIFFRAKWETAFSAKNTQQKDFHVTPKKTIQVPMMNREDEYYHIVDQSISCTVVRIPYQGNATALFILPSEGRMQQVENGLNSRVLKNWLNSGTKSQLNLYLPKFSIEGTYQLEKILPKLGIRDAFTSHADLSGITNHPNINPTFCLQMVHTSMVEVDESGTRAAAATGEVFTFRSARPMIVKINFNRPFLLAIVENMDLLFLGKLVYPTAIREQNYVGTEDGHHAAGLVQTWLGSRSTGMWLWELAKKTVMSGVHLQKLLRTEKMALCVAFVLLVAMFCPAVLCQPDGTLGKETKVQKDQNNGTQVDSLTLASINTDFAFSLYKELALKNPDKNIVFSPFSISFALAVLSLGASSNTLKEILRGLKFNLTETPEADIQRGFGHLLHMLSQPGDQVQISTGSSIFVEKRLPILAEFKEKARALYQAEASSTDFQQPHEAKKLINDYVSKQTHGKIKELISDLDDSALMVLVNYIYFKGKWKAPFDPDFTFESNFYLDNKRSVKVPMMNHKDLTTLCFRDEELSSYVVELKYRGNASALFILPDQGRMQQLEDSLQPETLKKWRDSLRPRRINELYLPKFSTSTDYSLEGILSQLGIREVFSTQADLSGITGDKDVRVSKVVHKAVLDVAETGTEAAAATGVLKLPEESVAFIKGKWKTPFDPQDTFQSEFHLDKKRTVMVPMMNIEDLTTPYFRDEELSCSVVELKYTGNASALFILPDEGKMQQLEASLQPETLRRWKDSLKPRSVCKFPKNTHNAHNKANNFTHKRTEKMALCVAFVLLVAVFCPAVLCQPDGTLGKETTAQEDQNNGTQVDSLNLASINTDFAFSLYKELALKNPDKNIVFSPFSISFALAVLSLGASSNTLEEILEGLKFNLTETPKEDIHRGFGDLLHMLSQPGDQVKISTGSAIFVEKRLPILAEFKEKARALYQAEASSTDFQQPHEAKKLINDYVSKNTHGKIKELISDLDDSALMVLVNYIYFKGEDGHWLGMEGEDVGWVLMIDELRLPKFSISTDDSMEGILSKLGIREVFSSQADLSGITGDKDLMVSKVVHKAVLDVGEIGTEAAAATGIMMVGSALILNPLEVYFDRSFLMIIYSTNTQTPLFMAKVTNPNEN
ncbi:plasma serine protease inhibitor-like protein [Cricetulus griseus]|nr:plasma serine protease inhibitor-like protein [Cricetulus griseus]